MFSLSSYSVDSFLGNTRIFQLHYCLLRMNRQVMFTPRAKFIEIFQYMFRLLQIISSQIINNLVVRCRIDQTRYILLWNSAIFFVAEFLMTIKRPFYNRIDKIKWKITHFFITQQKMFLEKYAQNKPLHYHLLSTTKIERYIAQHR